MHFDLTCSETLMAYRVFSFYSFLFYFFLFLLTECTEDDGIKASEMLPGSVQNNSNVLIIITTESFD